MVERQTYTAMPAFTGRNVPVTEIAKAMHKDAQYVKVGLQQGAFKFGYAIKLDGSNEYNYYCLTARFGKNRLFQCRGKKLNNKKERYPCRGKRSR